MAMATTTAAAAAATAGGGDSHRTQVVRTEALSTCPRSIGHRATRAGKVQRREEPWHREGDHVPQGASRESVQNGILCSRLGPGAEEQCVYSISS